MTNTTIFAIDLGKYKCVACASAAFRTVCERLDEVNEVLLQFGHGCDAVETDNRRHLGLQVP
jgi:hypothetical protein